MTFNANGRVSTTILPVIVANEYKPLDVWVADHPHCTFSAVTLLAVKMPRRFSRLPVRRWLPMQGAGTDDNTAAHEAYWSLQTNKYNCKMLSMLVALTPFIEQQPLWETISNPSTDGGDWPAMGPSQEQINYKPWTMEVPTFRCPSDPGIGLPALGRTSYAACNTR